MRLRPAVPLLLVLAIACDAAPDPVDAMRAAVRGGADAPRACAALGDADARGDCLVTWLEASPAPWDAALCPTIEHEVWRSECHFLIAEGRAREGRTEEALAACRDSGRFQGDCVGHLHHEAHLLEPGRRDALVARLREAFPEVAPPVEAAYQVERERVQVERLKSDDIASIAGCAGLAPPEAEACRNAAAGMLRGRWERRAEKDPAVRAVLCAPSGPPDPDALGAGTRSLRWERSEVLDAAVVEARARVCPAGG